MNVVIEIINEKATGNYYYGNSNVNNIFNQYVIIDDSNVDLKNIDCYVFKNNKLEFDNTLLKIKENYEKQHLKEIKSESIRQIKNIKMNSPIKLDVNIGGNTEKVTFLNSEYERKNLLENLILISYTEQDTLKVKVKNLNNNIIFVELNEETLKKLCKSIFELKENLDLIEFTALQGIERYSLEQLKTLDVNNFFKE